MFISKSILIIDDNAYVALDLADTVEIKGGNVVGPVATFDEAMAHLATIPVDAAILDADVPGAAAIAARLAAEQIPFVVQAGNAVGAGLRGLCDKATILVRPVDPTLVISLLSIEIDKAGTPQAEKIPLPPIRS